MIIKGPIHLGAGSAREQITALIQKNIGKVKLPFEATGFKSTKKPDHVDLKGLEGAGTLKKEDLIEEESPRLLHMTSSPQVEKAVKPKKKAKKKRSR